jgi:hypothetical protein
MFYFRNNKKNIPENNKDNEKINNIKSILIGKNYNESQKLYNHLRVVKEDEKHKTITFDYCKDRCNVILQNNIIIDISGFY